MLPEDEQHICPVKALAKWIHCAQINKGYIFRGIKVTKREEKILESPIVSFWLLKIIC